MQQEQMRLRPSEEIAADAKEEGGTRAIIAIQ